MRKWRILLLLILCIMAGGCVPAPRYAPGATPSIPKPYSKTSDERAGTQKGHKVKKGEQVRSKPSGTGSLTGTINYYLGTPYKFGGCDERGMDCSCFVQTAFKDALNVELPRTAKEQFEVGKGVKRDDLAFGDLVFFRNTKGKDVSHTGIYIGGGKFAHASSSQGVTITPLADEYFIKRYAGARRVLER